jgi:hypothetical protein
MRPRPMSRLMVWTAKSIMVARTSGNDISQRESL